MRNQKRSLKDGSRLALTIFDKVFGSFLEEVWLQRSREAELSDD